MKRCLFSIGGRYIIHHIAHDHAVHDVCKDLIVLALMRAKEALILADKDAVSYGRNTRVIRFSTAGGMPPAPVTETLTSRIGAASAHAGSRNDETSRARPARVIE